jgi:hypothetical protein
MAHIVRIVMAAEGKVVLGLEPTMVGAAELRIGSEFDHRMLPQIRLRLDMPSGGL